MQPTIVTLLSCLAFAFSTDIIANSANADHALKIGVIGTSTWGGAKNNPITGIILEQSKGILRMANINATYSYGLYPRILKQMERGFIDCAILPKAPADQKIHLMISHLYDVDIIALSRKGTVIKEYHDFLHSVMTNNRVGFPNGGQYLFPKLFKDPRVKKQIIPSQQQGPLMLVRGRIDTFIGMKYSLLYGINRDKLLGKTNYPGYPIQRLEVWLQCSNKSQLAIDYQERLQGAVRTVKSLKAFQTITDKWMSFMFINH